MKTTRRVSTLLCLLLLPFLVFANIEEPVSDTGFLVIAPDRGFMGNQEIRDIHESFSERYTSSLVFITEEHTGRFLKEGIETLMEKGVKELAVLPLFLSDDHPLYKHALHTLKNGDLSPLPMKISETMSQSYLVAEIFYERVQQLSNRPQEEALILLASGASDEDERIGIKEDLKQLMSLNYGRYHFADEVVLVFDDSGGRSQTDRQRLKEKLEAVTSKDLHPVVIPFDFTQKLDGMMSFAARLGSVVNEYDAAFNGADLTPHTNIELWLEKQANSFLVVTKENIGVVFMPHGSNYNWNRTMMDAIEEMHDEYMIEHAFSMADPHLIENAVRKLEKRGARAIVVVRVFSLESSFREGTEYVLGLRDHLGHGGHGHGGNAAPPKRIQSGSLFYTVGGLEASPLFADALLDRALELSKEPKKETIILIGHGTRSEEANGHWENNLNKLAERMQATAQREGHSFRDIQYGTWREDWPELRKAAIENIRGMVQKASENDGTAIVIPARTTQGGHAQRWLSDLEFVHNGKGFAPHPLFVEWVEEQIDKALNHFNSRDSQPVVSSKLETESVHSSH